MERLKPIVASFLLLILVLSCNDNDKEPCRHQLVDNYKGFSFKNSSFFKKGSYWVYEDSLSKQRDVVTVLNTITYEHILDVCSVNYQVTDAEIYYFSTFRKNGFVNKLLIPSAERFMVQRMHDVIYWDDSSKYFYYSEYFGPYSPWERDTIQIFNGKLVPCSISKKRTSKDCIIFTMGENIGIVRRKIFDPISTKILHDWKLIDYKVLR